jgi:membrane protein
VAGPAEPNTRTAGRRVGRLLLRAAPWLGLATVTALWARDHHHLRRSKVAEGIIAAAEPGRGRLAAGPARIPAKGWGDILWRTWRQVGHDRLPAVAGGVTFYSLLAIFPAIGVFVSLYGLFADVSTASRQLDQLAAFVPQGVLELLGDQMVRIAGQRPASLSVAFAVSLLLSVWSANAGVSALFAGLNVAYGEREKRNFVVRRAITYAFTFAGLVFLTAVTGILVALPLAVDRLGLYADNAWLIPFRWLVLAALAMAAFAAIYRFGPSRELARWRWVRIGAVFAAAAWIGGSLAFSWYVNDVAHFDATYGPLSAVVGFMVWIWFSVMVVLIGAELNAEIEHQTAVDSTTGAPLPLGARGATMADTIGARLSVSAGLARVKATARRWFGR